MLTICLFVSFPYTQHINIRIIFSAVQDQRFVFSSLVYSVVLFAFYMTIPCHFTRKIEKLNAMNALTNAEEMFKVKCLLLHSMVEMCGKSFAEYIYIFMLRLKF